MTIAARIWRHAWFVVSLAVAALLIGAPSPSGAQGIGDELASKSFITPFPDGDSYRLEVYGDTWAEGLISEMRRVLTDEARVAVGREVVKLSGLTSPRWDRDVKSIEETQAPHIAVVMLGAYDRSSLRVPTTRDIRLGTDEWRAGYGERVDRLMKAFTAKSVAVYWIGQPVSSSPGRSQHSQLINEIVRDAALRNQVKFIDTYESFAGEDGAYADYGPDTEGKMTRLRYRDGLHFTAAGYEKIAHFVEQEIRRDLRQARSERLVELIGDVPEQQAVLASGKQVRKPASSTWSTLLAPFTDQDKSKEQPGTAGQSGPQELAAEKADVEVPSPTGAGGKLRLTIERPAVAPSVVALVTQRARREKSAALGDTLVMTMADGTPLLSTVMPASPSGFDALRTRSSPTQMPIFKVWAKGERLPPRTNRADDASWPRPEPIVLISQPEPRIETRPDPLAAFELLSQRPVWQGPPLPVRNPSAR